MAAVSGYGTTGTGAPTLTTEVVTYGPPGKIHWGYKAAGTVSTLATLFFSVCVGIDAESSDEKYAVSVPVAIYGTVFFFLFSLGIVSCMGCKCQNQRAYITLLKLLATVPSSEDKARHERIEKAYRLYLSSQVDDPTGELLRKVMIDEKGLAWFLVNFTDFSTGLELQVALNLHEVVDGKNRYFMQLKAPNPFVVSKVGEEYLNASKDREVTDTRNYAPIFTAIRSTP